MCFCVNVCRVFGLVSSYKWVKGFRVMIIIVINYYHYHFYYI